MTREEAQRLAREKGVSRPLYALARVREFGRLRAHPGLIGAALAALGVGAGVAVRRHRRPDPRWWQIVKRLRTGRGRR